MENPLSTSKEMSIRKILVIGTVNVDTTLIVNRVPDPGESVKTRDYKQSTGGKGANSSISSFRSCHRKVSQENDTNQQKYASTFDDGEEIRSYLIAATGDDPNGKLCRDNLEENGIDISGLRTVGGQMTGMSVCVVEHDSGQNRIMSHRGANDSHDPKDYMSADLWTGGQRPDLLISHLALPIRVVEQILETAGSAGIDIVLNAAPAQPIVNKLYKYITHFIVNETEAAILSGRDVADVTLDACPKIAKIFLKKGVKNVVITLGEQGAYYARHDASGVFEDGHIPAYRVIVVDTTGAGYVTVL
jgi:ribokinase